MEDEEIFVADSSCGTVPSSGFSASEGKSDQTDLLHVGISGTIFHLIHISFPYLFVRTGGICTSGAFQTFITFGTFGLLSALFLSVAKAGSVSQ